MQIAEIKLTGKIQQGRMIPDAFATISRRNNQKCIEVTIVTPTGENQHKVAADSEEDVWSMAECLQYHLDGVTGTKSDIHDYYRILGYFMD